MFLALSNTLRFLLCVTSLSFALTVFAEQTEGHDSEEDSVQDTAIQTKAIRDKIVETRPPTSAIGAILSQLPSGVDAKKFGAIVDGTRGLNDVQRSTLKQSFQNLSNQLEQNGKRSELSTEMTRLLGGTLASLEVPYQSPPGNQPPNGEPQNPNISEQLKELQESLKKSSEDRSSQIDKFRQALLDRDRKNQNQDENKGRGNGQDAGGGQSGAGAGANPSQSNANGSQGGGENGRALTQLAKALGNKNNHERNLPTNNASSATPASQGQNENKDNRNNNANNNNQNRSQRSAGLEGLSSVTAPDSSDKKKTESKTDASSPLDEVFKNNAPKAPQLLTIDAGLSGKRSTLSQTPGNGGAFGGLGLGNGFGPQDPAGSGASGFGGAPIMGGGGAGFSGGDISGMRFDSDMYAGAPPMGLPKFSSGPIYGDSGGGGGGNIEGPTNGIEGELASGANEAMKAKTSTPLFSYFGHSEIQSGTQRSILDIYVGRMVKTVCAEAKANQVVFCQNNKDFKTHLN